ncbi:MAG: methyltransferase domain-containing protein [Deltaproteobacteria bacterium]|nr:methyltransferase domain-containing protein [Deltaproteobacteria bacterium]
MEDKKSPQPDVEAIMARIRGEVRERLLHDSTSFDAVNRNVPIKKVGRSAVSPLLYSEELNYLNANWQHWTSTAAVTSHRKLLGPLIVRIKRFLIDAIWNYILKDYFERERKFNMHLVRFLNESARYVDTRDAEIFSQVIEKIDCDVAGLIERSDRVYDEARSTLARIENELLTKIDGLETDRDILVEVASKIQKDIGELAELVKTLNLSTILHPESSSIGSFQHLGEIGVRGGNLDAIGMDLLSRNGGVLGNDNGYDNDSLAVASTFELVEKSDEERLKGYAQLFAGADGAICNLGCGRGDFLEILRNLNVPAFGVETRKRLVEVCVSKGLEVVMDEPLSYLSSLPDGSIGGIFSSYWIEHFDSCRLLDLLKLISKKVKPGGLVIIETVNPLSLITFVSCLTNSIRKISPIHPNTLRRLMELNGMVTEEVVMEVPVEDAMRLKTVEIVDALPARWKTLLSVLNGNVEKLNSLLFGHCAYCVVSRVHSVRSLSSSKVLGAATSASSPSRDLASVEIPAKAVS